MFIRLRMDGAKQIYFKYFFTKSYLNKLIKKLEFCKTTIFKFLHNCLYLFSINMECDQ